MLNDQLVRLLSLMHLHPSNIGRRSLLKSTKSPKSAKFGQLPDAIWDRVLDNLTPFERVKLRRVNQKLKGLVEKRRRRLLYADFLRTDVNTIVGVGETADADGEFHRMPTASRIVAHEETRSVLIIVDTHWSASDAVRIMGAIRYYGAFAHTVTLDASLAELCVAAQSTSDIAFWFAFQSANASSESSVGVDASPKWVPEAMRVHRRVDDVVERDHQLAAYTQWRPRTQLIPLGPLFPKATELTIRATIPQLRRLRRFGVYRVPLTRSLVDADAINAFRLVIATSGAKKKCPHVAQSLKLAEFFKWADISRLGHRFSIQFA
ncbi:unnamed protein product [Caenorhabditis bovis]|uniref:F-box domain-containing protein n=1 Tax=Caenorhabditis bovis TaxID=2654633 RepID=A0A8S1EH60_9PELO|nr:unnamed protein product [Caenorhabditis bovis]